MILDPKRNAAPGLARAGVGAGTLAIALGAALALYGAPRLALAGPAEGGASTGAAVAGNIALNVDLDAAAEAEPGDDIALTQEAPDGNSDEPVTVTVAAASASANSGPKPKPALASGAHLRSADAAILLAPSPSPEPRPTPSPAPLKSGVSVRVGRPGLAPRALIVAQSAPPGAPAVPSGMDAPPAPPAPPTPVAPVAPLPADVVQPPLPPRGLPPGRAGEIERRLDRLEELVESLVGPRAKPSAGTADLKPRTGGPSVRDPLAGVKEDGAVWIERDPHFGPLTLGLEQASRQIAEAARQAERAAREADKAFDLRTEASAAARESLEARRHLLDEQRRAIEKQIAQIEAQLGRLESHFDRVEAELDRAQGSVEALAEREREREVQRQRALDDHDRARDAREAGERTRGKADAREAQGPKEKDTEKDKAKDKSKEK